MWQILNLDSLGRIWCVAEWCIIYYCTLSCWRKIRKWAWWRNVYHIIFMLLCFCAGARLGHCSATVHLSCLSDHPGVTITTSTFTGRGFRDELTCSQDNYHPSSLPWIISLSKPELMRDVEIFLLTRDVTWYRQIKKHSRKAWFWSLLRLGYRSCPMLTRRGWLSVHSCVWSLLPN